MFLKNKFSFFHPVFESNTSVKNHFGDTAMCVRLGEGLNSITT